MKTYTVKIINNATNHNGETCGHKHRTEWAAEACRWKMYPRIREDSNIHWDDFRIIEEEA